MGKEFGRPAEREFHIEKSYNVPQHCYDDVQHSLPLMLRLTPYSSLPQKVVAVAGRRDASQVPGAPAGYRHSDMAVHLGDAHFPRATFT